MDRLLDNNFSENQKSTRRRNLAISGTLFVLALAIRLPELYESPGFLEGNELKVTLDLVHGVYFPLFNQNPHIGAFSNYLIASFFLVFGMHWWLPRAVVVTLGALTIPLTYLIGCRLGNERASFLGAVFMAFSMYHVLVLSHIPWSNNMSPFFAAACTLCLLNAIKDFKLLWLAATGFLFGLSLQTHPSMITFLAPVVLIYLFAGQTPLRRRLWGPAPIITLVALTAGYANMIYYNVANRLQSVTFAMNYPTYALEKNPEAGTYFKNLSEATFLLLRLLSGVAETKRFIPWNWLTVALILAGILLITGVVSCLRNREWQLPVLLLLPILTIPIFNKAYEFCQFGRYLGFLLIPAYLLIGHTLIRWFDLIRLKNLYVAYSAILFLSALILGVNLDQLRKFSAELEFKHSTMIVFRGAASALKEKVLKNTPLLVDRAAFKSSSLMQFLQTDGWEIQALGGTFWTEKKRNRTDDEARFLIQRQIQKAETKTGTVIVISSADFLPVLLEKDVTAKCVGCLAVQAQAVRDESAPTPLYFFMQLSKDQKKVARDSSLFVLSSSKESQNIQDTLLRVNEAAGLWSKSCRKAIIKHATVTTEICKPDRRSKKELRPRRRLYIHKNQKP